ncbi:MAG: ATP-dependent DNA helicase RecG [Bacilli bacterium]|nr:ATP-dependent DNA helicase RecG [Bacilli bacterium]
MKYLEEIDGIGPKTKLLLNKLNINTIEDLITYYPRKYNIIKRSDMSNITNGSKVIIDGIVESQPTIINLSSKLKKVIFRITNQRNIYNISAYNKIYLTNELKSGISITVIGKYDKIKNTIIANEVRLGSLPEKINIEPIYPTTNGLNRKLINKYITTVLNDDYETIDYIPQQIVEKYKFKDKLWSLKQIHNPDDIISYKRSLQRLKYEELFIYLFKINYFKLKNNYNEQAISRKIKQQDVDKFIKNLPFPLTPDQITVIEEIKEDLTNKKRMNRLVQGDVGSGKTIVAMIASYINYLAGYQTAIMVPTEILANQHYEEALSLFKDYNISIALLTSSTKVREKKRIYNGIETGEINLIIGTQSLIQEKLIYNNLGLIITDEQHRFGVNQRQELKNKGVYPDILSLSATPIPRTYALSIYGDMDVSSIKTKPTGRKDVITYYKKDSNITEVLEMMKNEIDQKHQIYVIAPSIIEDDEKSINNVTKLSEKMKLAFGKICKIGTVHGKLNPDEKNKVMSDFEKGKTNILISTTVIEVGVNVPNASMIVIFNANLFGLSTLHQLRGRVGRGDIQSYCILLSKEPSDRLKMLEKCNDGFEISEYDFLHRGEGDLFGIKQSGDIALKLADIKKDYDLLLRVKEDVNSFTENCQQTEEWQKLSDSCDLIDLAD